VSTWGCANCQPNDPLFDDLRDPCPDCLEARVLAMCKVGREMERARRSLYVDDEPRNGDTFREQFNQGGPSVRGPYREMR
jgi:hypothetical protein